VGKTMEDPAATGRRGNQREMSRIYLDWRVVSFVLIGSASLVFLVQLPLVPATASNADGYRVDASFANIGDLRLSADVGMAGITIGRVEAIRLDKDFRALVTLWIDHQYRQIPADSTALVLTRGILGARYLEIRAGASQVYLRNTNRIQQTQPAFVIEVAINQLMATARPP
jgi:phospholipid/cholesterol/gamma-HCH transport system substrate-binding protein